MSGITTHLARRAIERFGTLEWDNAVHPDFREILEKLPSYQPPAWALPLLVTTLVLYGVTVGLIRYIVGDVVATLLMVETPRDDMYLPVGTDAADQAEPGDVDAPFLGEAKVDPTPSAAEPDLLLIKQAPITSSIRGTLRHIRAKDGRFAKFRGLQLHVVYHVLAFWTANFIQPFLRGLVGRGVVSQLVSAFLATLVMSPLMTTWTHVVISEGNGKRWFRRIPDRKTWAKVLPATAVYAAAEQATIGLPTILSFWLRFHDNRGVDNLEEGKALARLIAIKSGTVLATAMVVFVLLLIPAGVTLVRVQASLLPESDETIVPFDRSFGGKVTPAIVGGSGVVGVLDAWRSFEWSARLQLVVLYAKIAVITGAVGLLFGVVMTAEASFAFGPLIRDLNKLVQAYLKGELVDVRQY
ncbi:MAG: hypothetical protein M1832_001052 [Thelocarpon impressellum]|nr:MAG: hypothetical protein M1832_001052 [Thelocarpon impressellum]